MSIPLLNTLPLEILILLGLAILGLYNYLKTLHTYNTKIEVFSNYRKVLANFHSNVMKGKAFDYEHHELRDYLLENAPKITLGSFIQYQKRHPMSGVSTGILNEINDIVTGKCYNFTGECQAIDSMLTQNIGFFKNMFQETKSKIINPISLVKNGMFLIFNIIPIINLTPSKIKDLLCNLIVFLTIINTLSSLFLKKSFLLSIIRQITTWISPNTP